VFYRLVDINGVPLPAQCQVGAHVYEIASGGILLEPPSVRAYPAYGQGHSMLRLLQRKDTDQFKSAGASSEPYYWTGQHTIQLGRTPSEGEARFSGTVVNDVLVLTADDAGRFIPGGTQLRFVAAATEPIPREWRDTFYYGPPRIYEVERWGLSSREKEQLLQKFVEARDREGRIDAATRLRRAWSAPP
jgi:hypothetical protein